MFQPLDKRSHWRKSALPLNMLNTDQALATCTGPHRRVDHAVDTSRLQKRQNDPTYGDYKDLAKVVREVKSTPEVVIKIRPVENMCVCAYTDSSLYGSEGELIPDDDDLAGYDKHKLHSQGGSLVVTMNQEHLDNVDDVPFSMGDWRTRASRRVYHSTFASEAQAAVEDRKSVV